ncbi:MAG: hypothetical protein CVU51_07355 [Deltaproteobacteria bacterium HGW-Deltaproteobacteria-1]|nr:MAG: hypothetical protein CVU51_07355 [Deltaproteobacteria bacterium HGW-Deltaproteobacteria-1]
MSSPIPPIRVSAPEPPLRILFALFPVITLFNALPVPLMALVPVNMRFSTLAAKVYVTELWALSVPALELSVIISPVLSTI